jgi:Mg2+/Co2+ transporter CorC
LFGRIPHANEELIFEPFIFKVQSVDTRRIKKIKATLKIEQPLTEIENLGDEK